MTTQYIPEVCRWSRVVRTPYNHILYYLDRWFSMAENLIADILEGLLSFYVLVFGQEEVTVVVWWCQGLIETAIVLCSTNRRLLPYGPSI